MRNVHATRVLSTLYKFDPVQVELTKQLHRPRPHRVLALASRLIAVLRRAHRRHASIRALERLPDWQLKDIGVSRSEIRTVVDQQLKAGQPSATRATASRSSIGTVESVPQGAAIDDRSQMAA